MNQSILANSNLGNKTGKDLRNIKINQWNKFIK